MSALGGEWVNSVLLQSFCFSTHCGHWHEDYALLTCSIRSFRRPSLKSIRIGAIVLLTFLILIAFVFALVSSGDHSYPGEGRAENRKLSYRRGRAADDGSS